MDWVKDLDFDEPQFVFGEGAFGKVIRGYLKSSHAPTAASSSSSSSNTVVVAIKTMDKAEEKAKEEQDQRRALEKIVEEFEREVWLMSGLNHINVVRLFGVCFEPKPALVMEVVSGGDLYGQLSDPFGLRKVSNIWKAVEAAKGQHTLNSMKADIPLPPFEERFENEIARISKSTRAWTIARSNSSGDASSSTSSAAKSSIVEAMKVFYETGTREAKLAADKAVDELFDEYQANLKQVARIDWPLRLKLATDIAQGMAHLHSIRPPVVHRDLKTPNIFLTRPLQEFSGDFGSPLAKVGDFGLSARMFGLTTFVVVKGGGSNLDHINPLWAAPEVLQGYPYTALSDVYAMGVMLWELVTREDPYDEVVTRAEGGRVDGPAFMEYAKERILAGDRPVFPEDTLASYRKLAEECWQPDPSKRPPFIAIFSRLRDICREYAPSLFKVLPEHLEAAENEEHKEEERTVVGPIAPVLAPRTVDGASESDSLKMVCLCSALEGRFIWAGFHKGRVGMYNTASTQWILCDEANKHAAAVNSLTYTPVDGGQVWSGSADGLLRVWSAQPKSTAQALEEIDHRGWLETKSKGLKIGWERKWVQLEGAQLIQYTKQSGGKESGRIDVFTFQSVTLKDDQSFSLECATIEKKKSKKSSKTFRVPNTKDAEAAYIKEWVRQIQHAIDLCARKPNGASSSAALVLQLEVETSVSNASIDCLSTVDGYVWSASSDFRLRQWDIQKAALDVGSGTARKDLYVLRHLELPMEQVEGRYRAITRMVSPLASNKQVWVAVGNRLAVVDLSQAPEVAKGSPSVASAVRYLEPHHEDVTRSLVRTRANDRMYVLSAARRSGEMWAWDSHTMERVQVHNPIPEGAGSEIQCVADADQFRWLVTNTHVCRFPIDSAEHASAEVSALPKGSRVESLVVGSDGVCVWLAGQTFSCWR